jgi:hypothetical protein
MRKRAGQSIIFEQVLLFGIGVAIFVALFGVFTVYQNYFASANLDNQLDEVKNVVVSNIIKLSEKGDVDAYVMMKIPRKISDEGYEISLSGSGLNVTGLLTGISKSSSLYGLNETHELAGSVMSALGRFIIYKKGNKIILS